jgi:hypothetical protein
MSVHDTHLLKPLISTQEYECALLYTQYSRTTSKCVLSVICVCINLNYIFHFLFDYAFMRLCVYACSVLKFLWCPLAPSPLSSP